MKKTAFGIAAAFALGLAVFSAPASAAMPAPAASTVAAPMTDVSAQRYDRRRVVRHGPRCTVRKEVRRGPMGRRVVRTVRVCR